jgi:hypothetical protein
MYMNDFRYFGYLVMAASVIIPGAGVWSFISRNHLNDPKDFAGLTMITLFIFVTMSTIGLIVLSASNAIALDVSFLKWLGGATVAEVAGICTIIVKAYFNEK